MKTVIPQTVVYWLPESSVMSHSLASQPDPYTFINAARYGDDLVQTLCQLIPNILLIEPDVSCPEQSVELIRRVRMWPKLPVKCVVLLPNGVSWLNAFDDLDVSGKVCTESAPGELTNCLNRIANGYRFLSPSFQKQAQGKSLTDLCSDESLLTCRERDVIELIALGHTNKEIAQHLFISVKTVETHKLNLMHKLELHSAGELRQWIRVRGISNKGIPPSE